MDKNNNLPIADDQQEQQLPVGDTQPFGQTGGEDRTIAFQAGQTAYDLADDILAEEAPAGWEEETVAVQVTEPEPDDGQPEEEQPSAEELPEQEAMPPVRPRNPFKRVPKRVYHRGRLFSLAYVLITVTLCIFGSVMFLRVFNDVLAFITENRAITVTIDENDTTDDVAAKLKEAGLIKYDWLFSYVAKFEDVVGPYEAGEHTLNDNMNYMQLLNEIEKKEAVRQTVQVTFIEGLDINEMLNILNKKSGVYGMTNGISSDFRDIEKAKEEGNHLAEVALDAFYYRVAKYIGAYTAAMNGVDAIAFTAGVGENDKVARKTICSYLGFMGVTIDDEANNIRGEERVISGADSKVKVMLIPTNEELAIARETQALV